MPAPITSSPLYAVAYHGGANTWVAGRGGAILRRTEALSTVKISVPKLPPGLRSGPPKLRGQEKAEQLNLTDDGDIPKAVPPVRKPVKP